MKKLFALLLVLVLLPLAGGAETVVTSFYPVWIIVLNLTKGIDGLEVVNLAESATGCLHDYTLRNSDMVALSRADMLLINGAGMESFLPVITGAYPDLPVLDASSGIPLIYDEEGEPNSHLWLDPQRAAGMAANLAGGMIRLMPQYEAQLSANLAGYRDRLLETDRQLRIGMENSGGRKIVVFHEAFPYFAEACGLQVAAVIDKEPEDDLSSSALAQILDMFRSEDPLPLIIKSTEEDRAVSILVSETGAPVCELDPMVTGPDQPPLDYYETVMLRNGRLLQAALQ